MKKLLITLAAVIGLSGCVVYDTPEPVLATSDHWQYGCVEYCDEDSMCREVCDTYYYYGPGGAVFYYDTAFGLWIGPHGYWYGGAWVHGWPGGFREHYRGFAHYGHWGGGYHGGYHGGGGFHGGGHGGHR